MATANSYGRNATSDYQHVLGIPWQDRLSFPKFAHKEKSILEGGSAQGVQVKSGEFFNVVPEAKLLNVIWPDSTELISGIRGTI